jgi:hypothetical protein
METESNFFLNIDARGNIIFETLNTDYLGKENKKQGYK